MSPEMPSTPMPPPPMGMAGPPPMPMRPDMAAPPPPMAARGPGRAAVGMGPNRAKGGPIKAKKYAKGGSVSSRADGCATKGKTKGRFV
jgi:hypothetical protein